MSKKIVFGVIGGIVGVTTAFIAGHICGRKNADAFYEDMEKKMADKDDELEWLTYEYKEAEKDVEYLREQLADANNEIFELKHEEGTECEF